MNKEVYQKISVAVNGFDICEKDVTARKITNKFIQENFDVDSIRTYTEKEELSEPIIDVKANLTIQEIFFGNKFKKELWLGVLGRKLPGEYVKFDGRSGVLVSFDIVKERETVKKESEKDVINALKKELKEELKNCQKSS